MHATKKERRTAVIEWDEMAKNLTTPAGKMECGTRPKRKVRKKKVRNSERERERTTARVQAFDSGISMNIEGNDTLI